MKSKLILTSLALMSSLAVSQAEDAAHPKWWPQWLTGGGEAATAEEIKNGARNDLDWTQGWKTRIFQPSARIYFDGGHDDPNEIDIYNDGTVVPTINLLELYRPVNLSGVFLSPDSKFHFGPAFGFGISAPAEDGDKDGDKTPNGDKPEEASDSPVLMLTAGVLAAFYVNEKTSFGIEGGYALAISADEGFEDCSDGALYVGLALRLDF